MSSPYPQLLSATLFLYDWPTLSYKSLDTLWRLLKHHVCMNLGTRWRLQRRLVYMSLDRQLHLQRRLVYMNLDKLSRPLMHHVCMSRDRQLHLQQRHAGQLNLFIGVR